MNYRGIELRNLWEAKKIEENAEEGVLQEIENLPEKLADVKTYLEHFNAVMLPYDALSDREGNAIEDHAKKKEIIENFYKSITSRSYAMLATNATAYISFAYSTTKDPKTGKDKIDRSYKLMIPVRVNRDVVNEFSNANKDERRRARKLTKAKVNVKKDEKKFYLPKPTLFYIRSFTQLMGGAPRFDWKQWHKIESISVKNIADLLPESEDYLKIVKIKIKDENGEIVEKEIELPDEVGKAYAYLSKLLDLVEYYTKLKAKDPRNPSGKHYMVEQFAENKKKIKARILQQLRWMYENNKEFRAFNDIFLPNYLTVDAILAKDIPMEQTYVSAAKLILANFISSSLDTATVKVEGNYPGVKSNEPHLRGSIKLMNIPSYMRLVFPEIAYLSGGGHMKTEKRTLVGAFNKAKEISRAYQIMVGEADPTKVLGNENAKKVKNYKLSAYLPRKDELVKPFAPIFPEDEVIFSLSGLTNGLYTYSLENLSYVLNVIKKILKGEIELQKAIDMTHKFILRKKYEVTIDGEKIEYAPLWVSPITGYNKEQEEYVSLRLSVYTNKGEVVNNIIRLTRWNKNTKSRENVINAFLVSGDILNGLWIVGKDKFAGTRLVLQKDKDGNYTIWYPPKGTEFETVDNVTKIILPDEAKETIVSDNTETNVVENHDNADEDVFELDEEVDITDADDVDIDVDDIIPDDEDDITEFFGKLEEDLEK